MPSHWGSKRAEHRVGLEPDRHAVPAGASAAPKRRCSTSASPTCRTASRRSTPMRSPTSRSAKAPPAKASSGSRSTPRARAAAGRLSWSRTTATPSRCRSKCRRPAATSRGWSTASRTCRSRRVDGSDLVASLAAMQEAVAYARARQGPGARPREGHPAVLALAVGRREALQDAARSAPAKPQRDPIPLLAASCCERAGHATPELAAIASEVDREVAEAADLALAAAKPDRDTAALYVYSPNVDPAVDAFARRAARPRASPTRWSRPSTRR